MEGVALIVVGLVVAWVIGSVYSAGHRDGKRLGSRKGYGVGFDRGRRARGHGGGCALLLALLGAGLAAFAAWLVA